LQAFEIHCGVALRFKVHFLRRRQKLVVQAAIDGLNFLK